MISDKDQEIISRILRSAPRDCEIRLRIKSGRLQPIVTVIEEVEVKQDWLMQG